MRPSESVKHDSRMKWLRSNGRSRERKEARSRKSGGRGSGRMSKSEQAIEDRLSRSLKTLRDGRFPGEAVPVQQQPAATLIDSARQHTAHHADAQQVPSGSSRGARSRSTPAARGASATAADSDGDGEDDDDERDGLFKHYYTISQQQRAFNKTAVEELLKRNTSCESMVVRPPNVLKSGCSRAYFGFPRSAAPTKCSIKIRRAVSVSVARA